MATKTIEVAPATDAERGIAVVTAAFIGDPVLRWVFPDAREFLRLFPELVAAFAGRAFGDGTALSTPEYGGAALWLGPSVGPDEEAMGELMETRLPDERKEEIFSFVGQMGPFHPEEPHWYLPLIGVDPAQQGRGYGSALLAHTLATCDRDGLPAYLEATSPRNRVLYERHGFGETGVIQVPGSPPMWPMVRKPR